MRRSDNRGDSSLFLLRAWQENLVLEGFLHGAHKVDADRFAAFDGLDAIKISSNRSFW
jgi:hypothetical protein